MSQAGLLLRVAFSKRCRKKVGLLKLPSDSTQWATRRKWPKVLFFKVQILEWIHLWLVYLTLKLNFQKSSQTLEKSMAKKFVHKSLIIRRRFLLLTYQNILKWKTISNEWLTHKLHCVKKLFRSNKKWSRKKVITGPKVGAKIDHTVFCEPPKGF